MQSVYSTAPGDWANWALCKRWKLIMLANGTRINENLSEKISRLKFARISRYKQLANPYRKKPRLWINQQEPVCHLVNIAVPANHCVKIKEFEKIEKYLDLARELKRLENMKVTVIPIVIGVLGSVSKNLETRGDLQSLRLQWINH